MRHRDRILDRLVGVLRHAEADTPEGHAAADRAADMRARYRVTDDEIAEAMARHAEENASRVVLDGWDAPYLAMLAGLVAVCADVAFTVEAVDGGIAPVLIGRDAGKAARRARQLRTRLDARLERAGGDAAVRALPMRHVGQHGYEMVSILSGSTASTFGGYTVPVFGPRTLGDAAGSMAADVFRLTLAQKLLAAELREAEVRERRKMAEAFMAHAYPNPAAPPPERPPETPPADAAPDAADTPPPDPPTPPVEPPPEIRSAMDRLMQGMARLGSVVRPIAQAAPPWTAEPPPDPTALACVP